MRLSPGGTTAGKRTWEVAAWRRVESRLDASQKPGFYGRRSLAIHRKINGPFPWSGKGGPYIEGMEVGKDLTLWPS